MVEQSIHWNCLRQKVTGDRGWNRIAWAEAIIVKETARAAEGDGAWVGVVRSSVYVSGHVEYVVDFGKFSVRAVGPEDPRLPHDARTRLHVSPPAVRVWPRGETAAGANGGKAR